MGQKRITIEVTEYQARIIRWALNRAALVTPERGRTKVFLQKLREANTIVTEATVGLEEIPMPSFGKR